MPANDQPLGFSDMDCVDLLGLRFSAFFNRGNLATELDPESGSQPIYRYDSTSTDIYNLLSKTVWQRLTLQTLNCSSKRVALKRHRAAKHEML